MDGVHALEEPDHRNRNRTEAYATDRVLYRMVQDIVETTRNGKRDMRRINAIKDYLADAGVYADRARREATQRKQIKDPRQYRRLMASGYTSQEADAWQDVDAAAKEIRKQVVAVWVERDGSIPKLTNHVTYLVIGETASNLKKTQYIRGSARKFMSPLEKAAISIVEGLGKALHTQRDSHGNEELERDLTDASQFIDMDKLKQFSDKPVLPPDPRPKQRRLPSPRR